VLSIVAGAVMLHHVGHLSAATHPRESGSACASDSLMNAELRGYLASIRFESVSSMLDFARGKQRGIRESAARTVRDARLCERGHAAYLGALGAPAPISAAVDGTVELLRVGSYYLVTERGEADIVLTTKDWKVLAIIGLDND